MLLRCACAMAVLALSGCSTVSKSECQSGDWYDIGVRDGARGHGEERFLENAKACAKHGISADRERWLDGRMRGLERYCTARNGFEVGAENGGYAGVCPRPDEDAFLHGLSLGKDLAGARSRLAHFDHEIHEIKEKLNLDSDRDSKDSSDHSKDEKPLTDTQRIALAVELGVLITKREAALRDVSEIQERGGEL